MRATAVVVRGMRMLALLLGVTVLAAAAPAEGQAARVLGRVTDGVGNAVAEARVTLVAHGAAAAVHETVSGTTGGFQFEGVAPGVYTLRATRDGVGVQERRVTVRAGQVVSQVVRLSPGRAALQVANAGRSSGL
ncbi:MAG TPA: carboxypeptidase-like regulatory domain-containing protein [Longimicrobium sp.]|nr:carboxypeptidase-like regulatory domain-containing protein [Longimicrobium sp.]